MLLSLRFWVTATVIVLSLAPLLPNSMAGELRLYLDADFTNTAESNTAIEQGILTALAEVDNFVAGQEVTVRRMDHRGESRRSRDNLAEYLADDKALAVYCGLHSPPVLANLEFINTSSILLLDPYAAASPITRFSAGPNWVFRLSVDDSKAGYALAHHAVKTRRYTYPVLLLEKTAWGDTNKTNLLAALDELHVQPAGIFWFNGGLREKGARIILHSIKATHADAILLVANPPEAIALTRALLSFPTSERLPVISHWGITGDSYVSAITPQNLQQLDFSFLQTSFSFLSVGQTELSKRVFANARKLFPESIKSTADIKVPAGFIHGYDLTKILIAAIEQTGITGEIAVDRTNVRTALENLQIPVEGLIKTYDKPFGPFSPEDPDAHEALGQDDLSIGSYDQNGSIILIGAETE